MRFPENVKAVFTKTFLLLFFVCGFSFGVLHASSFEEGVFTAEVLKLRGGPDQEGKIPVTVRILSAKLLDGTVYKGVSRYKPGQEHDIPLAVPAGFDLSRIREGIEVEIRYDLYGGMGPEGFVESKEWTLRKIIRP
jgi:hypothetical protein